MMIGCALDAWRLAGREFPKHSWCTDPRMRLVGAGGHRIRILDSGGTGVPVVFAADAPVVLEHYAPRLDKLTAGRRGLAIELPGFGFSTPARGYRFTLLEQVEALAQLFDTLAIAQATLAFSCINALVALAFAARYPTRVDRLVLAQIPSVEEFSRWAARIDVRVLGQSVLGTPLLGQVLMWVAPALVSDRWFRAALSPASGIEEFANISRQVYANGGVFCLAALNQALRGVREEDVGLSPVPTTVVWGDADRTHRKTDKRSSLSWHPHAELIHWTGAGHCPDLELPEAFALLLQSRA